MCHEVPQLMRGRQPTPPDLQASSPHCRDCRRTYERTSMSHVICTALVSVSCRRRPLALSSSTIQLQPSTSTFWKSSPSTTIVWPAGSVLTCAVSQRVSITDANRACTNACAMRAPCTYHAHTMHTPCTYHAHTSRVRCCSLTTQRTCLALVAAGTRTCLGLESGFRARVWPRPSPWPRLSQP